MTGLPTFARLARPASLFAATLVVTALCVACAHNDAAKGKPEASTEQAAPPPNGLSSPPSPPPTAGNTRYSSAELGVSIELPSSLAFTGSENIGTLAVGGDSSEVRVFIEHLATPADEVKCWERLYKRVPGRLLDSPRNVDELKALATAGIRRGDRFIYLSVHPTASRCYVLVAEGPKDSKVLPEAVAAARKSLAISAPSKEMAVELDIDSGMQLLDSKEYVPALASFERALTVTPQSARAQFGAGLAAYFAGPTFADKAIEHLSAVTSAGASEDLAPQLRPEQLRDALMYLGLSYASKKDYPHATSTLAELVARTPNDATGRYNLACILALSGDSDAALGELSEALEREPSLVAHAKEDEDLKSLRGLPEWKELFQKLAASSGKRTRH